MYLTIVHDESASDPRNEFSNLGKLVCFHKRYALGDTHNFILSEFGSWDNFEAHLKKECDAFVVLPVYMYEHSGITISTNRFSCPWDSGQIGFIYATKTDVDKEFKGPKKREKVEAILQGEIKTYDMYLSGEVYGWRIVDSYGAVVDDCYGYYGEEDAKRDGEQALENLTTTLVNCEK